MSSTLEDKILVLQERLRAENESRDRHQNDLCPSPSLQPSPLTSASSPAPRRPRHLGEMGTPTRPRRQLDLPVSHMMPPKTCDSEFEAKLQEIMGMNGILNINGQKYQTEMSDLEHLGELGNGTCGHVVKMRHKPSGEVIAVKQMRRSGNSEENKRIIMDLDVVLKSHDSPYIVQCLGCFITESDVWICMELMATCLEKLLKKSRQPIPEDFLGKVTVATVKALSYLKEKHGVIHRDVKPGNILLDESECVKLCDFGISGRLVDSKAKTRSAGCAAYMAPERIDPPDPTKPDYDIRADVWSLGITLVELATGVFPYRDCKTDFEVLSRVVQDDPPQLPLDKPFSADFRNFVNSCLTKNYKNRPKYHQLMEHPFIRKYDRNSSLQTEDYQWFRRVVRQLETRPESQNHATGHISLKQTAYTRGHYETPSYFKNAPAKEPQIMGYVPYSPYSLRRREVNRALCATNDDPNANNQRSYSPYRQYYEKDSLTNGQPDEMPLPPRQKMGLNEPSRPASTYYSRYEDRDLSWDRWQKAPRSLSPFSRDYSPWRRENVDPPNVAQFNNETARYSPFVQRLSSVSAVPQSQQTIYGSPMVNRKRYPAEVTPQNLRDTTSPLLSRLTTQCQDSASALSQIGPKESAKMRIASYVKLRLGNDRTPSPEPPPRLSRGESPLVLRRNLLDQPSPSFSRRHVSPLPPQPPPRRLSESCSVPGSPQHFYFRLPCTPELQRKPPS